MSTKSKTTEKSVNKFSCNYLSFSQAEGLGERLPLCAHHIVIALEGVLQLQQLRRRECSADPLGLSEGLQQEVWK